MVETVKSNPEGERLRRLNRSWREGFELAESKLEGGAEADDSELGERD